MRTPFFHFALLCSLLALTAAVTFAADAAKVSLSAKNMTSRLDGKERVNTFTEAKMTQGEAVFTAGTMVSRGEKGMEALTGTGAPRFVDPVCTGTADTVVVNTKTQVAQFSGHAQLLFTMKSGEDKVPMIFTAEKASYDYGKRQALFSDGATLTLEGVTITFTGPITYDRNAGTIVEAKGEPAK
ncbi:MAG TPA: hypothetical protein VGM23_16810 [Armatimonadota bacterium]|jgi:hypothetical protein